MTILSIVQDVADETQLFERPTTVIGNSNKETRQSLSFLKTISEEIQHAHDWQAIIKEQTFTSNGTGSYTIADIITDGDYLRHVTETDWDRSNEKKIRIVNAQEWQYLKSGIVSNVGIYRDARVRGDNIIMDPDASGDTLVFEYVSKFYARDSSGTLKATYTADDDTSAFPETLLKLGLKYYLKTEYELPSQEDALRYYDRIDSLKAQEKPAKVITPRRSLYKSQFVVNIPDSGAGL